MITQRDLNAVQRARKEVADLAADPKVQEYVAAQKTATEALAAIRTRFEAGEEVQSGKLRVRREVKVAVKVLWEKALKGLREVPAIAKAIGKDAAAKSLLELVQAKSPASPYVTSATSVTFDVVPAE